MAYKMKGFSGFGNSPAKQKDKFGKIKKGEYPNLPENVSEVQKDKKGLYTTGTPDQHYDTHSVSDTTRYPKGFSDWKGELKEGDYIDETTHEAWGGVDVESTPKPGKGQKATGKRKVYNKKTKKYEDYKSPGKAKGGPKLKPKKKSIAPNQASGNTRSKWHYKGESDMTKELRKRGVKPDSEKSILKGGNKGKKFHSDLRQDPQIF